MLCEVTAESINNNRIIEMLVLRRKLKLLRTGHTTINQNSINGSQERAESTENLKNLKMFYSQTQDIRSKKCREEKMSCLFMAHL